MGVDFWVVVEAWATIGIARANESASSAIFVLNMIISIYVSAHQRVDSIKTKSFMKSAAIQPCRQSSVTNTRFC